MPAQARRPTLRCFRNLTELSLVNLNRPLADGSRPIIGGPNPPDLSVKWENVLSDPSKAAGQNNAIIGRYAFWVDDEGAKINVNTADGTEKYTTNSLGIGSPSEVSLEVLFSGGNAKDLSKEIVGVARTEGFSSPREILRSAKVPADAYTDNVFALTAYSRSPELNIFGQPRMALTPILGAPEEHSINMVINGITLARCRKSIPRRPNCRSIRLSIRLAASKTIVPGRSPFGPSKELSRWGEAMISVRVDGFIHFLTTVISTGCCWRIIWLEGTLPESR